MNKSQLRLLAAEVADGRIDAGEYRARRRALIESIVAGSEIIERVPPHWQDHADADEVTTLNSRNANEVPSESAPPHRRLPLPIVLAAGSALCAIVLIAMLWPEPEAPIAALTPPTVPEPAKISQSRALVESFVARRDFSSRAIGEFRREWEGIDASERDEAHNELWFGSLVRALRDEVKTQKALAGLAAGEAALDRAKAVYALGEFLQISDKLPAIDDVVVAALETITPAGAAPAAREIAAGAPSASQSAPTAGEPTGRQWLDIQADEKLTLQIFAVNHLDRVEQIIEQHPDIAVHIVASDGASPRYRIFHGVFSDEAAATRAYADLPATITSASHGAIVKSFSVVREDLRRQASPAPAGASPDAYTLQVFATGNRDSARALVKAFPALDLKLHESSGDTTPYRVVFGDFASADDARTAAATLPPELLARIGTPLPKSRATIGTLLKSP